MAAEITGSGDSGSASYATTITWIAYTTGSHGTGLTFPSHDLYEPLGLVNSITSTITSVLPSP